MNRFRQTWTWRLALGLALALGLVPLAGAHPAQQAAPRTFPETGQTVQGAFLAYWDAHGGLAQQGYPISAERQERSDTDGNTYTVQYFERAVFELHPANSPPNDVLLALLGVFLYDQKYPNGAPGQTANTQAGSRLFPETGKHVGGVFLDYWTTHGGLAQQGFPISEEFAEVSALDGKAYTVQYFQRAVFEVHPENKPPYDVLLSQLGTFRNRAGQLPPTALPPTALPQSGAIPQPPEFAAVRARFEDMTPAQYIAAGYTVREGCKPQQGFLVINPAVQDAAYASGTLDPLNPTFLILSKGQRVRGLLWETPEVGQPPPVLFGQQVPDSIAFGGDPRYVFHAYFKPNGYVLFAFYDMGFSCFSP